MAHRLAADSEPGALAQLFHTVDAERFAGDEHVVVLAERRAEIDKFGRIEFDAGHAQYRARENTRRAGADREPVALCAMIDVVCELSPTASRHVFRNDRWMSGNVFLQEVENDLVPQVAHRSEERRVGKECRSRWAP